MWSIDTKCKYMFTFPQKKLARKGLSFVSDLRQSSFKACVHPTLDLWDPEMKALYARQRPIRCNPTEENWVEVINGTFHITERASRHHGNITCRYTPLKRGPNDFSVEDMETINITHGDPITNDFFTVRCVGSLDNKAYANLHSGIYKKATEVHSLPTDAMGFNVFIFG